MSRPVFTNRVSLRVDVHAIDQKFDIWHIQTDLRGKKNYGRVISGVYKQLKPLSIARHSGGYFALVRKGGSVVMDDPCFSLHPKRASDLTVIACARLLIHAMPHLSSGDHFSEGVGLFYLQDIQTIRKVEVVRAFEVKLEQVKGRALLQIKGATFTPVSYHTNADGELYKDCAHLPRLSFDKWSQRLTRSRSGEFLKKKHRDKRMTSEMVSLNAKDPGKFWKSKMGILFLFLEDVQKYLGGMLSIKLEPLSSSYRMRFKESHVSRLYQDINRLLATQHVNIVNLTDTNLEPLLHALNSDDIPCTVSSGIDVKALNWIVHYDKEFYEDRRESDPYQSLHLKGAVVQSSFPETLFGEKGLSRSQYEACKKELLVKYEVSQRRLQLVVPEGEWTFISVDEAEGDSGSHYLRFQMLQMSDGDMVFRAIQESDSEMDDLLCDLPRIPKNGESVVIDGKSGEGFIFSETGIVAIPEFELLGQVMRELQHGYDSGIRRVWIEEFIRRLALGEVIVSNPEVLVERLEKVLKASKGEAVVSAEILVRNKDTRLSYKGGQQVFFDWIYHNKGVRLGVSLKSADAGLVEASLGLFFSEEERLYFVGDKDNIKNIPRFSVIRHIVSDVEVPVDLLAMMAVFHIRHRQATVYPFPFKHLAEWSKLQKMVNA